MIFAGEAFNFAVDKLLRRVAVELGHFPPLNTPFFECRQWESLDLGKVEDHVLLERVVSPQCNEFLKPAYDELPCGICVVR